MELGSGPGLLGVLTCKTCSPHSYIFSDYHEKVLQLLHENIRLNNIEQNLNEENLVNYVSERNDCVMPDVSTGVKTPETDVEEVNIANCDCCRKCNMTTKCKVQCWKLDWQDEECFDLLKKENIDVVIGSGKFEYRYVSPLVAQTSACVVAF